MSPSDPSSTTASPLSTPESESRRGLAADDTRAAPFKQHRGQCWHKKEEVLPLLIKPVRCLAVVRALTAPPLEASSKLSKSETKSFADRERCSVAENQRTDAKTDFSYAAEVKKRLREPEYVKDDIYRLRIKPVRNLAICRVPSADGGVLAKEASRHSRLLPAPAAARFTATDARSGAATVRGDDARKEDQGRTYEYAKADIVSLRVKPLKGYAVYRVL
ncbi:hypothetical protein LSCM4_00250 [Leishmania orientalis]|uniref:Uncharacterized protein n=1 Tax=Leishmania orientalis TaxID=2249476 RepID=A0A836K6E8_9TRYP|nr:hypothetical protein LSCM4_00250 [Leishmania orientalis]